MTLSSPSSLSSADAVSNSTGPLVTFVLVEPSHPGNIGAAARAIKTMGFRDLRVVNPREVNYRTHDEAVAFATSSVDVLTHSQSFATLEEALADVSWAWSMTGYDREYGPPLTPLREASLKTQAFLESDMGRVAFVFGNERTGLSNAHILLTQGSCAIACDPESPSLNVSQAVQLTAYEMHMARLASQGEQGVLYDWQARFESEKPASLAMVEGFFEHWERAMIHLGVHCPTRPKHFMPVTRRLFQRANLTPREIDLLRGICAQILEPKHLRQGQKKDH